jgi:hypothetical protein
LSRKALRPRQNGHTLLLTLLLTVLLRLAVLALTLWGLTVLLLSLPLTLRLTVLAYTYKPKLYG